MYSACVFQLNKITGYTFTITDELKAVLLLFSAA